MGFGVLAVVIWAGLFPGGILFFGVLYGGLGILVYSIVNFSLAIFWNRARKHWRKETIWR